MVNDTCRYFFLNSVSFSVYADILFFYTELTTQAASISLKFVIVMKLELKIINNLSSNWINTKKQKKKNAFWTS